MDFKKINAAIPPRDEMSAQRARDRWNTIAKPVGSLGLLEDAIVDIAALIGTMNVCIDQRAVVVFCADNGVVEEGVAQTGQDVTALVAGNMLKGQSAVCLMARTAHADVFPVDIGMCYDVPGICDCRILKGTSNIAKGPAMSREDAVRAIECGINIAEKLHGEGYRLLISGEMGIGNTTTSGAVAAVLLGESPKNTIGRGAGLSKEGLFRKQRAISVAIEVNQPDPKDAIDVVSKIGGLDIAGMAGLFIGGALYRIPVLVDGVISATAALVAKRICPAATQAIFATHQSSEPSTKKLLDALGKKAFITANMRLGEGTGALCALPLLDMALSVYNGMVSFDDIGLAPYDIHNV